MRSIYRDQVDDALARYGRWLVVRVFDRTAPGFDAARGAGNAWEAHPHTDYFVRGRYDSFGSGGTDQTPTGLVPGARYRAMLPIIDAAADDRGVRIREGDKIIALDYWGDVAPASIAGMPITEQLAIVRAHLEQADGPLYWDLVVESEVVV